MEQFSHKRPRHDDKGLGLPNGPSAATSAWLSASASTSASASASASATSAAVASAVTPRGASSSYGHGFGYLAPEAASEAAARGGAAAAGQLAAARHGTPRNPPMEAGGSKAGGFHCPLCLIGQLWKPPGGGATFSRCPEAPQGRLRCLAPPTCCTQTRTLACPCE